MALTLLYFAWMKDRVGHASETFDRPEHVTTLSGLIDHLKSVSPGHADAFSNPSLVRAAIDQTHADLESDITEAQEIAFFPPVTGGYAA